VQYNSWAACEAAIEALHDKVTMPAAEHPLVVKFADAKKSDTGLMQKRVRRLAGHWWLCGCLTQHPTQHATWLLAALLRRMRAVLHAGSLCCVSSC
jgi:hypothetical protein